MAYKDPASTALHRSNSLAAAVNSALNSYYQKHKTPTSKQLSISVSHGKGGQSRTPEEQAFYLLKGTSWTANSSHMADGAKHILLRQGAGVVWNVSQLQAKQKGAFEAMVKAWNTAMKTYDLRNYKGGKEFDSKGSDPLHMELPDSRLHDDDPRVIRTLEIYAKATRLEGAKRNLEYEIKKGSPFQKKWLQEYDAKLAASQKKGTKSPP